MKKIQILLLFTLMYMISLSQKINDSEINNMLNVTRNQTSRIYIEDVSSLKEITFDDEVLNDLGDVIGNSKEFGFKFLISKNDTILNLIDTTFRPDSRNDIYFLVKSFKNSLVGVPIMNINKERVYYFFFFSMNKLFFINYPLGYEYISDFAEETNQISIMDSNFNVSKTIFFLNKSPFAFSEYKLNVEYIYINMHGYKFSTKKTNWSIFDEFTLDSFELSLINKKHKYSRTIDNNSFYKLLYFR